MNPINTEVLLPGPAACAPALVLTAAISFWGGVDPKSGVIADTRHPQFGQSIAGRALLVPATVGSSSAAAILLELVHAGLSPAAMILHEPDAILLLGLIVAKEMGYVTPIAVRLARDEFAALDGKQLDIAEDGVVTVATVP